MIPKVIYQTWKSKISTNKRQEFDDTTICLNMIVKNESNIIIRLFDSILPIIDSYCICDTGSTDNTIEIIKNYFDKHNIHGKIIEIPFKNFGYNRNVALKAAKNMASYILLLDADMILEIKKDFDKSSLIHQVYTLEQGNDSFKYSNTRLVKGDLDIKCVGPTHEYYDIPNGIKTHRLDNLFIRDIGDGGCKEDKFIRDIRLLKEGLKKEPKNGRYYFYIANSYLDLNKLDEAIEAYKKRIEIGGWVEEVWYSYYKLGLCYQRKEMYQEAIATWLDGYNFYPRRSENIYEIVKHYRYTSQHQLSYHFYKLGKSIPFPADNTLFLHKDVYDYKFDYELSVIAYYINPRPNNVMNAYMKLFNSNTLYNSQHLLSNFKFYAYSIKNICDREIDIGKLVKSFEKNKNYMSSSPSILSYKNGYLLNIRFVNYKINEQNGSYSYYDGHNVETNNTYMVLDKDFNIIKQNIWENDHLKHCRIRGLEDVKIVNHNNKIYFISTRENTIKKDGKTSILMAFGEYDISKNKLEYEEITSPYSRDCEKNWSLFVHNNKLKVIYEWNPLTIGNIIDNKLVIEKKMDMSPIFKLLRGSTNGYLYNNELWFIGHLVENSQPRHYYHCFIVLDSKTLEYKNHSKIFNFDGYKIEFCLGLIVEDNRIILSYSNWDRTSKLKIFNKEMLLKELFEY